MKHHVRSLLAASLLVALALLQAASAGSKKDKEAKPVVINGQLTDKDVKDTKLKGSRAHPHSIALRQGVLYVIDLVSKDFDAYLRLEDAAAKPLAEDDDGGGGTNARLFFIPPKTGDYTIVAAAYQPKLGNYRLTVQESHLQPTPLPLKDSSATAKGTLSIKSPRSPFSPHNGCALYRVDLKGGKTYQLDLESADFDAYLTVADARMIRLDEDDDSGGKRNARIRFACKQDGTYYIAATGLGHPDGSFTLKIRPTPESGEK